MLTTADLLTIIEEHETLNIKSLAKKLEIPQETLHKILTDLQKHSLVNYNPKTGKIDLPKWINNINKKIEKTKPATGEIILPKYQEIKIQDILIGNYTKEDLELKIRLKAKQKEIAICNPT
ncbi:MAG: MarR family transcriptional regulator [Candidatus Bathyarchaeales archaeon]